MSEKAIVVMAVLQVSLASVNEFSHYTDNPTDHTETPLTSTRSL